MSTAVLYNSEQSKLFLNDLPEVSRIYPLTPNALAELKNKVLVPKISPIEIFTNFRHRRVLAKVRKWEKILRIHFKKEVGLGEVGWEVFKNVFHIFANSICYLDEILRGTGPWLIHDGKKWVPTDDRLRAVDLIFIQINKKYGFLGFKLYSSQKGKIFLKLVNFLILKFFIKQKNIWITGLQYNFDKICKELNSNLNKFTVVYPGVADKYSILRAFKTLFVQFLPFFKKPLAIEIVPITSSKKNYMNSIKFALKKSKIFKSNLILELCSKFLSNQINYSESLLPGLSNLVKETSPSNILAHHVRWSSAPSLAYSGIKEGIKVSLISHGTHVKSYNNTSKYALNRLAEGLLVSKLASETLVQSPHAYEAALEADPNQIRTIVRPIMWGSKISKYIPQKKKFTILHAGTYKVLGQRPWIYETSNEYLNGLEFLLKAIEHQKNIRFIIRIRDEEQECTKESIKSLLNIPLNCRFSESRSFKEDLENSDLLISFSSTTLEEALYSRLPVGLFGGNDRYNHLPGSDSFPTPSNRSAVYHLKKNNLEKMLQKIVIAHKNKKLTDKELYNYVWRENIRGEKDFFQKM